MTKLSQILAVAQGHKASTNRDITEAHKASQKTVLLSGLSRTYEPKDDEGDRYPSESTRVQLNHTDVIAAVRTDMTRLIDLIATVDATNCVAKANVIVDGTVILEQVPVTTLLALEKQLVDWRTVWEKLPTLDPSENWTFNDAAGVWASDPVKTVKSKKIPRNHVKAEATDRHPAQVDVYTEDVPVGFWTTVKFSGATPATEVKAAIERTNKLIEAVKFAREAANMTEVIDAHIGGDVFRYLLG